MGATAVRLIALILVSSACAQRPPTDATPSALAPDALPGMESELAVLGPRVLADDALDPESLERLLSDAGFVSGSQRTFSGPGERFSLAVTRVLSFETAGGAERYVSWLREHPRDLLGTARMLDPLEMPGSPFLMVHLPGGCCPKDVPIYVSAWRRGSSVLYVRASGRRANVASVEDLAIRLDQVVADDLDA